MSVKTGELKRRMSLGHEFGLEALHGNTGTTTTMMTTSKHVKMFTSSTVANNND